MKCSHVNCKKECLPLYSYCQGCLLFMVGHTMNKTNVTHVNCHRVYRGCECMCNKIVKKK